MSNVIKLSSGATVEPRQDDYLVSTDHVEIPVHRGTPGYELARAVFAEHGKADRLKGALSDAIYRERSLLKLVSRLAQSIEEHAKVYELTPDEKRLLKSANDMLEERLSEADR